MLSTFNFSFFHSDFVNDHTPIYLKKEKKSTCWLETVELELLWVLLIKTMGLGPSNIFPTWEYLRLRGQYDWIWLNLLASTVHKYGEVASKIKI